MKPKIFNVPHWAKWLLIQIYLTPTKVESCRIVKMTKSLFTIEMTFYSKYSICFSAGKRLYLNCSTNREVLQGSGTIDVSKGLFEKLLSVLLVNCLLKCSFKNFLKYFLQMSMQYFLKCSLKNFSYCSFLEVIFPSSTTTST